MEKLKKQIIEESRHQFIYGSNNYLRKTFLQDLENNNPIIVNDNKPIIVYLDEIGLPDIKIDIEKTDKIRLYTTCREYLSCIIAQNILKNINEESLLNIRIEAFLNKINRLFLNDGFSNITSLHELINALKNTRFLYYEYYLQHIKGGITTLDINSLKIPFLDINLFTEKIKEMLNNHSYFCIIADQQHPISIYSQQALNSLINMRINANISIKVACKKDEWKIYCDLSGLHINNIHDYTELDINKYLKLKKDDNYEKFNNK